MRKSAALVLAISAVLGVNGALAADAPDQSLGKQIPTLALGVSTGGQVKMPDQLMGRWTVLYFYPKDDTPGCTKEACSYRDSISEFKKIGVQVFGVSLDNLDSHSAFTQKNHLNFPLLADSDHKLSSALGVYGGLFLSRDTFLVGPDGQVKQVWRKVSPTTTTQETLASVKAQMKLAGALPAKP